MSRFINLTSRDGHETIRISVPSSYDFNPNNLRTSVDAREAVLLRYILNEYIVVLPYPSDTVINILNHPACDTTCLCDLCVLHASHGTCLSNLTQKSDVTNSSSSSSLHSAGARSASSIGSGDLFSDSTLHSVQSEDKKYLNFSHKGKQFDIAKLKENLLILIKKYNNEPSTPSVTTRLQQNPEIFINKCFNHVWTVENGQDETWKGRIMSQNSGTFNVKYWLEEENNIDDEEFELTVEELITDIDEGNLTFCNQFVAYRGVSYEEMEECIDLVRNSCHLPQESREKLVPTASAKVIKDIKELQDFIKIHGRSTQYSFQLKKCTDDSNCSYCQINPVRMDKETFQSLSFLPCPVPDKDQQNHYQTFDQVYGNEVDDSHRPSRNSSGCFPDELEEQDRQHRDIFKTQKARDVVKCMDCLKPRLVFCNSKLSPSQEEILNQMTLDYICGDGTPEDSGLFMRRCITCSSDIEVSYYSAGLRTYLPPICIYCGSDDKLLDDNDPYIQDLHEKYSVVRPLCTISFCLDCYQCNSTLDHNCQEKFVHNMDKNPLRSGKCTEYGALYCIKITGLWGGIVGTHRFCSSRDLGNQCQDLSYPDHDRIYRACVYTCGSDDCNSAATYFSTTKLFSFIVIGLLVSLKTYFV
ncbi:hypothetical protein FSP39_024978 [Pinctada imbricata]|uniref:Protein quiver n=1 Tax=Pinctada imbricata TaxID=66713 RepID=A0AA88XUC2_PINIB|nr:hypothetical protein FSP39_024978 [Pinctada imbricata]